MAMLVVRRVSEVGVHQSLRSLETRPARVKFLSACGVTAQIDSVRILSCGGVVRIARVDDMHGVALLSRIDNRDLCFRYAGRGRD